MQIDASVERTAILFSQFSCISFGLWNQFRIFDISLEGSNTLSPSLESIPSLFLCGNGKMQPPPWVQLPFGFSLLPLLDGDVSFNPGPSVQASVSEL